MSVTQSVTVRKKTFIFKKSHLPEILMETFIQAKDQEYLGRK